MLRIGVIPSRLKATRFPDKPLAQIAGKSLIRRVVERTLKSQKLDKVILATDNQAIANEVKDLNCQVVFTDPELPSGTDRVNAAVKGLNPDIVINIQGDEPLIQFEVIDQLVTALEADSKLDLVTLGQDFKFADEFQSPNNVKVILNDKSEAIYFSRFPIPFSRAEITDKMFPSPVVLKHIGLYGFRYSFLHTFCQTPVSILEKSESLEQLRAMSLGAKIKVIKTHHFFQGVDVPEDIQKVENWIKLNHEK
ncbi:MAG: 3-deoxy-manno-octulosonate cytidylyltransferase [Bdellovibrionaceae bacterium]|nr:3-deoxy-manno-octulosonate cytidylyltransferase [Pseudobdellovibrionaceae bacterium]